MRKRKTRSAAAPYAAGLILGFAAALIISAAGAVIIALGGSPSFAGIISAAAVAGGSFICGRTAGAIRRSGGLKTGVICSVIIFAPLLTLSLIFGQFGGVLIWIKAALCISFGAAGGVFGVNSTYGSS